MRPVLAHFVVLLLLITTAGATGPKNSEPRKPAKAGVARGTHPKRPKPFQVGSASWYGKYFHGRKTASGESYDMFQFTAAHRVLPLGTLVKVTNLQNRRWVIVRINDRGPIPKTRIIDLSYGAAQMLRLRAKGVERVRLDLLEPEEMARVEPQRPPAVEAR